MLDDPSGNPIELFQPAGALQNLAARGRCGAWEVDEEMKATPAFDHIALTVPDLDEQVERLAGDFGMVVQSRSDRFAMVADPASGLKLELSPSDDSEVRIRHLGFRADDLENAHRTLVEAGMEVREAPHRRDFARMYTSFLKQPGGVEVQLVKYD